MEVFRLKWVFTSVFGIILAICLVKWFRIKWWYVVLVTLAAVVPVIFNPNGSLISFGIGIVGLSIITSRDKGISGAWFSASWEFAKQISPLLFL